MLISRFIQAFLLLTFLHPDIITATRTVYTTELLTHTITVPCTRSTSTLHPLDHAHRHHPHLHHKHHDHHHDHHDKHKSRTTRTRTSTTTHIETLTYQPSSHSSKHHHPHHFNSPSPPPIETISYDITETYILSPTPPIKTISYNITETYIPSPPSTHTTKTTTTLTLQAAHPQPLTKTTTLHETRTHTTTKTITAVALPSVYSPPPALRAATSVFTYDPLPVTKRPPLRIRAEGWGGNSTAVLDFAGTGTATSAMRAKATARFSTSTLPTYTGSAGIFSASTGRVLLIFMIMFLL